MNGNSSHEKTSSEVLRNQEALQELFFLGHSLQPGSIYEHYNHVHYKILSVIRHSESLEEVVVYQSMYGSEDILITSVDMFFEKIEVNGELKPRLRKI